jgi:hypothetical protein
LRRWCFETPFHRHDRTWVLSKVWGADTMDAPDALLAPAPAPAPGYDYESQP